MTPWKTGLLGAATAIVLTSGWRYQVQHQRRDEAARLQAENRQLRLQASQRQDAPPQPSQDRVVKTALLTTPPGRNASPDVAGKRWSSDGAATREGADEYRNE